MLFKRTANYYHPSMSDLQPTSAPISRIQTFESSEGPNASTRTTQRGTHHRHHQHSQEPNRIIGPGFSSGPAHWAGETHVRYVLVTPENLAALQAAHSHGMKPIRPTVSRQRTAEGTIPSIQIQSADFAEKSEKNHFEKHQPAKGTAPGELAQEEGQSEDSDDEDEPYLENPWARFRYRYRQYFAEFIGTMILILFGNGVNCQVVLSKLTAGSYLSISFGWGIGVCFGVYASGGISGGHINPAVTIALATFRGFPWRKVPGYCLSQILGAIVGSCLVQGNYHNALDQYEGGYNVRTYPGDTQTGALFFTQAQPYMSNIGCFFSEFLSTAILMAAIFAIGDNKNNPPTVGTNGIVLLFLILGIGAAFGTETAYCLNLARDWGPRIACAMYGYPTTIWTYRNWYWLWTPGLATVSGGLLGGLIYDLLLFSGEGSPINRPWSFGSSSKKSIEHLKSIP